VKAGAERKQHSRPARKKQNPQGFESEGQVLEAGFNMKVIRKDDRRVEPGKKRKGATLDWQTNRNNSNLNASASHGLQNDGMGISSNRRGSHRCFKG